MTRLTITAILSTALMALTMSQTATAAPHHGAPIAHRPAMHHAAPARHYARPAYRHRYYVHHDVVGALAAGALMLGAVGLINHATQASTVTQPSTTYVYPSSPAPVNQATRFWCESEKGFYPDVRACPTGWTPIPAN